MKKLLPILIGLSLTGFSAMSERKTCFRFTSRHASATPICVNRQPIVTPRSKDQRSAQSITASAWAGSGLYL